MAKTNEQRHGPFAKTFAVMGLIAGGIVGLESGGGVGMIIGAVVLAAIGGWIGQLADAIVAWLIFVAFSIIFIMVNAAIRRFVWEIIQAIVSGA